MSVNSSSNRDQFNAGSDTSGGNGKTASAEYQRTKGVPPAIPTADPAFKPLPSGPREPVVKR